MTVPDLMNRIVMAEAELMASEKATRTEHIRHWVAEARQTLAGMRTTLGTEGLEQEKSPAAADGR